MIFHIAFEEGDCKVTTQRLPVRRSSTLGFSSSSSNLIGKSIVVEQYRYHTADHCKHVSFNVVFRVDKEAVRVIPRPTYNNRAEVRSAKEQSIIVGSHSRHMTNNKFYLSTSQCWRFGPEARH